MSNLPPILDKALKSSSLHHAYLLIGKREDSKKVAFTLINELGVSPADFMRFTEDLPIKIEEIRNLIKSVYLKPHSSPYKIVLIEKAENIAPEAGNALLKTLEEPPPQTIFVLLSENPNALLETIISRCQKIKIAPSLEPAQMLAFKTLEELTQLSLGERFLLAEAWAKEDNLENIFTFWLTDLGHRLREDKVDAKLASKVFEYAKMSQSNVNKRLLLENLFLEL